MIPNWYVITGGPSSGKTTLMRELEKLGHTTVHEAARSVIDEGLARGKTLQEIRRDEMKFQEAVLRLKLETELTHDKETLSFLDRGVHDTAAYYQFYKWELDHTIKDALKSAKYKAVFLLDHLPHFEKDYARTEDKHFTHTLKELLRHTYESHNLKVIDVPVLSPKQRAQFILDAVDNISGGQP